MKQINPDKMNRKLIIPVILSFLIFVAVSCNKEETIINPVFNNVLVMYINNNSAVIEGGYVSNYGNTERIGRGICWSEGKVPTTDDNVINNEPYEDHFVYVLSGLSSGKNYKACLFITSKAGTGYGKVIEFTVPEMVTDIDGNTYKTVTIGTQTWMAENLSTSKYRNGIAIPNVTNNTTWVESTEAAYCNYNNDASNSLKYGRLYNWYAASDSRNLAPAGWHVPSNEEWEILHDYISDNYGYSSEYNGIGGYNGKTLASSSGWELSDEEYTVGYSQNYNNTSGFCALPGGYRGGGTGTFDGINRGSDWWSSTQSTWRSYWAYGQSLWYNSHYMLQFDGSKEIGAYIRCVRDK